MSDVRHARTRRVTAGLLAAAALTMAATATAAPASAAEFNCDASALRGTVLAASSIEPSTANHGQPACQTDSAGVVAMAPPVSAGAVYAHTTTQGAGDQRRVSADGGVTDLRIAPVELAALNAFANVNIPGVGTVDLRAALRPTSDLLSATTVVASAAGRCTSGHPELSGSATVAGLSVLGQTLPSNDIVNKQLAFTVTVDPSNADLSKVVPDVVALRPLIQAYLDTLPDIAVAQVNATLGGQTNVNGKLTQHALDLQVTSAGENVTDVVVGEASTSAADVDCAPAAQSTLGQSPIGESTLGQSPVGQSPVGQSPVGQSPVGQSPVGQQPGVLTPEQQQAQLALQRRQDVAASALSCTTRRLVLIDVLRQGSRVKLFGAADKRYIGRRVGIVFTATGRTVARAIVRPDGTFSTTAQLPSRAIRDTNRARYQAVRGGERSLRLKLARRMVVTSLTTVRGKVTIAGRVIRPLGKPIQPITVQRRVSCTRFVVVTRVKPSRSGRFEVTMAAPTGQTTAVYRLSTWVRKTTRTAKLSPTFTLPRAISLRSH